MSTDPLRNTDLANPQGWNAYAYVRNNPLRFTDPTGMYTAGCGDGVKNCDKQIKNFQKTLDNLLKSKNEQVRKAAAAYGKLGEKNGVNVSFVKVVDPQHANVPGQTGAATGTGGFTVDVGAGTVQQATQVDVQAGLGYDQLRQVAVHEGSHVMDRAAFVGSIRLPNDFDRFLNISRGQSELRAYGVENLFLGSIGQPLRDIGAIMANPPYSDSDLTAPLFGGFPGP